MKRPPSEVAIHHFDDEPEKIESLRDNILALLLVRKPNWIRFEELPEVHSDPEHPWKITVHANGDALSLRYLIYSSTERFLSDCDPGPNDIVILDAFEIEGDGRPAYVAFKCATHKPLERLARAGRILVSSAYLSTLPHDLRAIIPEENLVPRPFNLNEVVNRLFRMLELDTEAV